MRFSYAEAMCDPSHYMPLAKAAEEAGYTSMTIPDSICYPEVSDSRYPYTPDGERTFIEDKPFIEPFVLMGALAAVTTKLRFTTFVVKLPIRQPVLMAKQAASLAVLSATGSRSASARARGPRTSSSPEPSGRRAGRGSTR
jgi:alkanesulfonate monooxygenase SsuD/methylene tetrahydromethanopterin reductase-like flavin-dependent oxidoreductase (luciferase family)